VCHQLHMGNGNANFETSKAGGGRVIDRSCGVTEDWEAKPKKSGSSYYTVG
jgi:hypothetical protein